MHQIQAFRQCLHILESSGKNVPVAVKYLTSKWKLLLSNFRRQPEYFCTRVVCMYVCRCCQLLKCMLVVTDCLKLWHCGKPGTCI